MHATQRTCLAAGILIFGLGLAKPSLAITGCTNTYLSGTYNSQITTLALGNAISAINAPAGTTGSTGATGAIVASGATAVSGGLGGNPSSINGYVPGLGRFYFDGNGNVMGLAANSTANAPIFAPAGIYAVASNCTAAITMNSGQHYNAVIVDQGNQALFVQSDANGNGAAGVMQRSTNSCGVSQYPQNFGFQFSGALPAASSETSGSTGSTDSTGVTGSTGATGVTGTTGPVTLTPFSAVGILSLDGNGNFNVAEYQYAATGTQTLNFSGTYTVDANCSLNLSLTKPAAGVSGTITPPAAFAGLIGTNATSGTTSTGLVIVQPVNGQVIPGIVISQ
jgi:hypothetical protein